MDRPLVVVAMSGGVDSSVAAALLVEQGYRVIGMMLRLWSEAGTEENNRCCTPDSMAQARKVAQSLGIPFYTIDIRQRFFDTVVRYFLEGYRQGVTPNPCIVCNRVIRWGALFNQARALGAEFMATGHYARVTAEPGGEFSLLKGLDAEKDQSYVLSVLNQNHLAHSLFPIGNFLKSQVRDLARKYNLPTASRADSQDLCFLAGGDYRSFLERHIPDSLRPGNIVTREGEILGQHLGLANYTIGQRKGLGVPSTHPMYVLDKDVPNNQLIVGPKEELGSDEMWVNELNWVGKSEPAKSFQAEVKIRYKAPEIPALITLVEDDLAHVKFERPLRDITPGQRAVFYQGDVCLGGGTIVKKGAKP